MDIKGLRAGCGNCRATIAPVERVAKAKGVDDEISVESDEPGRWLAMPHYDVRKIGTARDSVAPGAALSGVLRHKDDDR